MSDRSSDRTGPVDVGSSGVAARLPSRRVGFALPQVFVESPPDIADVAAVATAADRAGCHSVWTQSQLTGTADVLEPLTLLSYVAACTEQVALGCSVLIATEHAPVQLAKQLSSLDVISNGRVLAGLGIGAPKLRLRIAGPEPERRVARMLETIEIMRAMWSDGIVDHDGDIWSIHGEEMNPKPIQQPGPPLWIGGRVAAALSRSARVGDGWMGPGASPISEFLASKEAIEAHLAANGRDRASFKIAKRVYLAVEDDLDVARRRVRERFARYSSNPDTAMDFTVMGDLDSVVAELANLLARGADLIVLNPVYEFRRHQEQLLTAVSPVVSVG